MKKLEYLIISNVEDKHITLEYKNSLSTKSNQELSESCRQEQKLGIIGVRRRYTYWHCTM